MLVKRSIIRRLPIYLMSENVEIEAMPMDDEEYYEDGYLSDTNTIAEDTYPPHIRNDKRYGDPNYEVYYDGISWVFMRNF
jgi:hypothetical protein